MSVTTVQVQLPSFSHSFTVSVPSEATILDFKNEITRTCIGSPNTSGQRVIYKGRVLDDNEVAGQVWKAADETHICHLAVHPSAWTSAPPNNNPTVNTASSLPTGGSAPFRTAATNVLPPGAAPLQAQPAPHATYSYIQYLHTNALRILSQQPRLSWPEQLGDMESARTVAKRGIEATGRGWPSYLNHDFPPPSPEHSVDEGIKYASTYIDNLPYLSLLTPDATPTPIQAQAIRVLSYTFPLLCVYPSYQAQSSSPMQLNIIPPRTFPLLGVRQQGQFFQIPIRPLILPLILLTIRTTLLLYFFQPARKPLFGLMVLAWVTWEVAGAVRAALGENGNANGGQNNRPDAGGNAHAAPGAPGGANAGGRAGGAAGAGAGAGERPGNNNNATPPAATSQDAVFNHLAHINLAAEAPFAEPDSTADVNTPPPGLAHKVKMFFVLLFLTLHPAIWDRRRTVLRAREGRVRDAARMREAQVLQRERELREREENHRRGVDGETDAPPVIDAPEPPPSPPRPLWVAEYVQRVRSGDWVDE